MGIVATMSLPAVDHPNADRWNAARSRQKKKRLVIIVATTSLPAVDRPHADRWNAARSRQNLNILIFLTWQSLTKAPKLLAGLGLVL